MLARALPLGLLTLLLLPPAVPADTVAGGTYGVNLGYADAGRWSTYWFSHPSGGRVELSLTWDVGVFPGADYDLVLYPPGSLDDERLTETPVAKSNTKSFAVRSETIRVDLPPHAANRPYVVAVVPHQAQGETFTLRSDVGDLHPTGGVVVGVRGCDQTSCG